jgi:hypothetical protein
MLKSEFLERAKCGLLFGWLRSMSKDFVRELVLDKDGSCYSYLRSSTRDVLCFVKLSGSWIFQREEGKKKELHKN